MPGCAALACGESLLAGSFQSRLLYGIFARGFFFPGSPPGAVLSWLLSRPTGAAIGEDLGLARHCFRRVDGPARMPIRVVPGSAGACLESSMRRFPILEAVPRSGRYPTGIIAEPARR